MQSEIHLKRVDADGINIFYRESGPVSNPSNAPVVLLLHGYPSSSHQFRNLIPQISHTYRVLAPDLPGFGFTSVPDARKYLYSFDNLATTIEAFLDALSVKQFSIYIFDYGAPIGLRLAIRRPTAVQAIISQNGNAYTEGLSDFWDPLRKLWKSGAASDRKVVHDALISFEATKWQYTNGVLEPDNIAPEAYWHDWAMISRPGNADVQMDLFESYKTNLDLYPQFQEYFRKSQVPMLGVWGKNDAAFPPAGAEAFKRDLPKAEVHLLDTGHFALETHLKVIAALIQDFLGRVVVK